ncbi:MULTISPECIES: LysR family transcriptional regulator [unclassified Lactobacillus]|uniref:LysR family transcriptional regulator n=1 Tax=unclassified Lactobacillus TaxID=2620435 RepID=UPI000EFCAB91|nr:MULTISPECIES: LysR family transcriptional regulator [unclassified Lactobacillus]RMC24926.1 LysR family transcriptional regulator [Lactobacillus sp. ESL0247]RMC29081.1 LysR family transcriptional regulator [Lactobacillus sp. ESL0246]RMC32684.1 LysR family transcriptional regulator [Lactobacillus sp. ESL0245]
MNTENLRVFINLAETLNYSKTAAQIYISQPAVSQNIAKMERELGFQLFTRTRRSVNLTKSGSNFYQGIKPMLNSYYKTVQESQRLSNGNDVDFTLGYSGTPYEVKMVPKIVRAFKRQHSKFNIYLANFDHYDLKTQLQSGECDVILTMPDIIAGISNVKYIDLYEGSYQVHFFKNSGYKPKLDKLDLTDLKNYRLIMSDSRWCPPSQDDLQKSIQKANKVLNLAFANNISVANTMTHANLGVGIWADFVTDPEDHELINVDLKYAIHPHYGIAKLNNNNITPASIFCKWIRNEFINLQLYDS